MSESIVDATYPVKYELSGHTDYVKKIQMVILLDTTGSMKPFYAATKKALRNLILQMPSDKELEVGLVRFNDYRIDSNNVYAPEEASCCIATDFTSATRIISILDNLSAGGGGDAPEALSLALRFAADTTKINWDARSYVSKTVIVVGDAPPHGLGYVSGDSFSLGDPDTGPNGYGAQLCDPNGELMHLDPLTYVNALKDLNVSIHTVKIGKVVDPKMDIFMKLVASLTGGKAMAFDEVCTLGDVIAGVSLEDAACAELAGAIASEMEKLILDGVEKEAAAEAAVIKVAETADSDEFVSVDADEIPLDDRSLGVFRSLSSDTNLKMFRTATKTLTEPQNVSFPIYTGPARSLSGVPIYTSLDGEHGTEESCVPHHPSLAAVFKAPRVPGSTEIASHLSDIEPVDEDVLTHPVYRSSANLLHTSAVSHESATVFRSSGAAARSGSRAPSTPPSTPSPRSSETASSASVKKGLTPALLARAAARAASSA